MCTIYNNKTLYIVGGFDRDNCINSDLYAVDIRMEKGIKAHQPGRMDLGNEILKYNKKRKAAEEEAKVIFNKKPLFPPLMNQKFVSYYPIPQQNNDDDAHDKRPTDCNSAVFNKQNSTLLDDES